MLGVILKLIQDSKGRYSSARAINVYGALIMSILILFDTCINRKADAMLFGAFATYCAGAYGLSKGIDVLESKKGA